MALAAAVFCYFILHRTIGTEGTGWVCILAALPFALCGFFRYNGMYFEQFFLAVIRSELLYPRHLAYHSQNLYVEAMKQSGIKEVLTLD